MAWRKGYALPCRKCHSNMDALLERIIPAIMPKVDATLAQSVEQRIRNA